MSTKDIVKDSNKRIKCECKRWRECEYGGTMNWKGTTYEVCGYSFLNYIDGAVRGCSVEECDKFKPRTRNSYNGKVFNYKARNLTV